MAPPPTNARELDPSGDLLSHARAADAESIRDALSRFPAD